jgi:predicted amidophosphoribosyltransferase
MPAPTPKPPTLAMDQTFRMQLFCALARVRRVPLCPLCAQVREETPAGLLCPRCGDLEPRDPTAAGTTA